MSFRIIGTGSYLPDHIVTNDDLSSFLDTSDEWIVQRVGVKERRISTEETVTDMACIAAERALENSNLKGSDIDLIICATCSSDSASPSAAAMVQAHIGAGGAAFDVNSACSGFLFALETAAGFFERGTVKRALVLGAERISRLLDWTDRSTAVIFGDGAGAVVLEAGDGYLASKLTTTGGNDVIDIPAHHGSSPFFKKELPPPFIMMKGQETFKFAVSAMTRDVMDVLQAASITPDQVRWFIPHQANIRIIQFASKKLKVPMDRFAVNIEQYGNTSSASVPIALDECNRTGQLKPGDIITMAAFGGGLSSAACVIKW
ncbi:MAG: ketoacyl-ACP synthase III [Ruminococcaceae bacterium]|nr:ketoacyl-ACP synthase III [Oscillospiraceae bacterium]